MSFKTLLVHAEPDWGSGDTIVTAMAVAKMFNSHIVGVAAESFDASNYAFVDGSLVQMLRDQVDQDIKAAGERFRAAVAGNAGGSTLLSWIETPAAAIARCSAAADLIIGRRLPSGSSSTNLCHPADLFMNAGAPLLLTPRNPSTFDASRILVAWKDCREARRALTDAIPFLQRAEHVQLLAVRPAEECAQARSDLGDVVARLARHGVKAEAVAASEHGASTAQAIETAAVKMDAGLIVAGAYSHNRVQEWVLGGVTQDFVEGSGRSVLFSR